MRERNASPPRIDDGGSIPLDVEAVPHGPSGCGMVVAVTHDETRLDEREVGQFPVGGVLLELGERQEMGGQTFLQAGVVDDGRRRKLHRLGHVDLPGLTVIL
jgi:hypothetical protein